MRFESITAHSFGPLVSATLEPSEGLTVVAGPNESGKSSWHAATYAALCGRRRGKGAPAVEDRQFADQRKPWDGRGWKVGAVAVLANGRRIELTHDLAGGVDSSAVEIDLGRRDVSSEIISDGAPDGSRWLGLDRRSFAATALVSQADVLSVLHHAQGLQELLQRAAATAGTDETAAAALTRLRDFNSEHVGLERVNSRKPLRTAQVAVADARSRLDEAQRVHAEYLRLVEQQQTLERGAQQCRSDLLTGRARLEQLIAFESVCRALEAAAQEAARAGADELRARAEAADAGEQARKAHEAWAACGGIRPLDTDDAQQEIDQLQACFTRWSSLPEPETLVGESSDRLRERITELPDSPDGDTAEHVDVVRAAAERDTAMRAQEEHERAKPPSEPGLGGPASEDPDLAAAAAAGASFCRELASQLAAYDGDRTLDDKLADAATKLSAAEAERRSLEQQLAEAQSEVTGSTDGVGPSHGGARRATAGGASTGGAVVALGIGAGVLLASGIALLAIGQVALGAILLALAGIVGVSALVMRRRAATTAGPAASSGPVDDRVRQLTEALRASERKEEGARGEWTGLDSSRKISAGTREAVVAQAEARGLPSDPAELRRLAAQVELGQQAREAWEDWARTARSRQSVVETGTEGLRRALNGRGVMLSSSDDVVAALQRYRSDCESNAALQKGADEKARLEAQLTSRVSDEQRVQRATATHQAARSEVIAGATAAGLHVEPSLDDEALTSAVQGWLEAWHDDQREVQRTRDAWTQLETLLSGRTIEQMDALTEVSKTEAEAAAAVRVTAEAAQGKAESERRRHVAALVEMGRDVDGVTTAADAHRLVTDEQVVVGDLQHASDKSRASAAQLAGQVAERGQTLVSVPECEEALAAAERELTRVEELGRILRTTVEFLEAAQDRVHRDIAPVLSATMSAWLPQLTEGRYTVATVDPSSLHVQVQANTGVWRDADKLSVGTREQVYLLLRVALAQHLPNPAESCPLILDDVTVQADEARTRAMLEWLLVRSAERQIILFAQEPLVAEWARGKLGVDGFSLVELEQLPTSSGTPA